MLDDSDPLRAEVIGTERCARAFGRLFWLFVFMVDLRIGGGGGMIDLLPDTIGWLIAVFALRSVEDLAPRVAGLWKLAALLAALNVFTFIEFQVVTDSSGAYTKWRSATWPVDAAIWALDLLFVWRLCGLVVDLGSTVGRPELSEKAEFRRRFNLAVAAVIAASGTLLFLLPASAVEQVGGALVVYAVVLIPIIITLLCLLLGLMRRAERACRVASRGAADSSSDGDADGST